MSVRKNFLYNSAYQLLVALAPLITTPYLSRVIGAEGNGAYTYTQSIMSYFVLFAVLGMGNYGVRVIAECGEDRAKRSEVFWNVFGMNIFIGGLVFLLFIVYAFTLGRSYLLLFLLWGFNVLGAALEVTWLLFGRQEFRIPTIRNFCTRLAGICCIFLFVKGPDDIWAYVLATAGPVLANSLFMWLLVPREVDFVRPTWDKMLIHLKPNLALFAPVVAINLYTSLDKTMLGTLAGMEQTGYYDYAEKVSKMPMSVVTALGAVVLPKMSQVIAAGRHEEARGLVGSTMWFMQACALALSFGVAAVAPEFVPAFLGEGYEPCVTPMRILSVIVPLICATNVLGVQWLLPNHHDRAFTLSVTVGGVVNLVVNFFAIPAAGALGASWATVAAELSVLIYQAWAVRDELPIAAYLQGALPFVAIGAAMFVVIRLFVGVTGSWTLTIGGLLTEVAVGAVTYLVLALAWCRVARPPEFPRVLPRLARLIGVSADNTQGM